MYFINSALEELHIHYGIKKKKCSNILNIQVLIIICIHSSYMDTNYTYFFFFLNITYHTLMLP